MTTPAQQHLEDAIQRGDLAALDAALQAGAQLEALDPYGFTPLLAATHCGWPALVERLLAAGASFRARVQGTQDTALHRAARYGLFCRRDGRALTEQERAEHFTPIVQALLNTSSDPGLALESEGRTPLALAAEHASARVVELLLEARADPNAQTFHHDRPLELAVKSRRDRLEKVQALLTAGADPTLGVALPLAGDVLPEELAVEICRALLDAGAPVDQATDGGWTALTHAVASENAALVRFLIERGARADLPIRFDERDASLSPGLTAARIAQRWELTDILDIMAGASQRPPEVTPLSSGYLEGRWELVAAEFRQHEYGPSYAVEPQEWDEAGLDGAFLHFHGDGTLTGYDGYEVEGTWELDGQHLFITHVNFSDDLLEITFEMGNARMLLDLYDEMGGRVLHFERAPRA